MMIRLELPLGPTINHYYGRSGTRGSHWYLSAAGKAFRESVYAAWLGQPHRRRIEGPVRLRVVLAPKNRGRFDVDNRLKPLLDALQNAGVFNDDSQITDIWASKVDPAPPKGWCHVEITDVARTA